MKKGYILMARTPSKKHPDFYRWDFKYFDDYLSLQKHLTLFPYMQNNDFKIFEETDIKRDKAIETKRKKAW